MELYNNFLQKLLITSFNKDPLLLDGIDNWICGFINGEGSFSISNKGILVFHIEQI